MKNNLLTLILGLCSLTGFAQNPPTNDEPANATELTVSTSPSCTAPVTATMVDATYSATGSFCPETTSGTVSGDVWFKFTATGGDHTINITNNYDTSNSIGLAVYEDYTSSPLFCSNYSSQLAGNTFLPGTEYFIRLYKLTNNPVISGSFDICIVTPTSSITVTDNQYTTEELVTDVLINSSCLTVSNITSSTGINFDPSKPNGIGYFEKGISDFPFDKGIVLSTGSAIAAIGPNTTSQNAGGWPGDDTLLPLMDPNANFTNDATSLEFDFVPVIDNIKFNFIFASKEYGTFQCSFSDAFAFFLTDTSTGIANNLAVIPGTTIPVTVVTINDNAYNSNCASNNPEYFGNYYGNNPLSAPVNFNGTTIPLTAQSTVIPGHTYHIKLVIADRNDSAYDSAVFIDAGSFNIGTLDGAGVNLTSSTGNILCPNMGTALSLNEQSPTASYVWSTGETTPSINVEGPGSYSVAVSLPGACTINYSINIVAAEDNAIAVTDYVVFDNDGQYEFNLNTKTTQITNLLGGDNYTVAYYETEADAEQNANPIAGSIYTNTANPQTLFVKVQNTNNNCAVITGFDLVVLDVNYQTPAPAGQTDQSFTEGQTLADIYVEGENIQWYDTPGIDAPPSTTDVPTETPLPLTTLLVDGTTYYASQTVYGIESQQRLAVTVHLTMGIENNLSTTFTAFPNPVKDILTLSAKNEIGRVTVYNLIGQPVLNKTINASEASLNLGSIAKGVYLLKVETAGSSKTIKIVKE